MIFTKFITVNWRAIAIVGGVIILLGGLWEIKANLVYQGRLQCENDVLTSTTEKVLEIEKEHRKIRSNRPTVNRVINRLYAGTF